MNQFTAYLAPRGYVDDLVHELGGRKAGLTVRDRLVLKDGAPEDVAWAQNTWLEPRFLPISSIKDGVRQLKEIQRNWALYSTGFHRRAKLIQEQLPPVKSKRFSFGDAAPTSPLGSWTLWDKDRILASPACTSPFAHGEVEFEEDKVNPPNRAYLKLWEAFTLLGRRPGPGELCIDMGGCPGGWSWVAAECGARVFAIDKAPLEPRIERHPRVQYCHGSGFAPDPRHMGHINWLFSDMACYPERLLQLVHRWLDLGECDNFLCTVKLQGKGDLTILREFRAIPGSRLLHLHNNKHELTWIRLSK